MYWQVYLHKTVICAEEMLVQVMSRAKELALSGKELFAAIALWAESMKQTEQCVNISSRVNLASHLEKWGVLKD